MDTGTVQRIAELAVVGAVIAAGLKKAAPQFFTAERVPLAVLALAAAFIAIGVRSGEIHGGPIDLLIATVSQWATTMGLREAVVAIANSPVVPDAVAARITGSPPAGS